MPDGEDGTTSRCGDSTSAGDAGGSGAYPDASTLACHVIVVHDDDGGLDKTPSCSAAGQGKNGASCGGPTDCASGFECVGSPGICRRYCCDSDCKDGTFCDIQNELPSTEIKVPVCEPVKGCTLGATNPCETGETCAIVDDNGTTSCVATGPAEVAQSCDTVHCAANLVCLGDLNSRKCYALCNTTGSDCASPLNCTGSAPLFPMGVGVCQ